MLIFVGFYPTYFVEAVRHYGTKAIGVHHAEFMVRHAEFMVRHAELVSASHFVQNVLFSTESLVTETLK